MTASYLERELIRGDSRLVDITVTDKRRQAIDISGCKVFFTLTQEAAPQDDTAAKIKKSTSVHTDPTHGKTRIQLTHDDTKDLEPGTHYFNVQVVDAFGHVVSKKRSTITVLADSTVGIV